MKKIGIFYADAKVSQNVLKSQAKPVTLHCGGFLKICFASFTVRHYNRALRGFYLGILVSIIVFHNAPWTIKFEMTRDDVDDVGDDENDDNGDDDGDDDDDDDYG